MSNELQLTQEDITELCRFPLRGHRYEFVAGEQRKDGKFPLYLRDVVFVSNGNSSHWSRRNPQKVWRTFTSAKDVVRAMNEAVYLLNYRRNGKGN
jgi:hypothetical protein